MTVDEKQGDDLYRGKEFRKTQPHIETGRPSAGFREAMIPYNTGQNTAIAAMPVL
jgi:hypothetical protein